MFLLCVFVCLRWLPVAVLEVLARIGFTCQELGFGRLSAGRAVVDYLMGMDVSDQVGCVVVAVRITSASGSSRSAMRAHDRWVRWWVVVLKLLLCLRW